MTDTKNFVLGHTMETKMDACREGEGAFGANKQVRQIRAAATGMIGATRNERVYVVAADAPHQAREPFENLLGFAFA